MDNVVRTNTGLVQGVAADRCISFKGIPYAAPPVGKLRFRAPTLPAPWEGVHDASAYGPVCAQPPMMGAFAELCPMPTEAGDNCLTLNVWAPRSPTTKHPVLVWIHGGGFLAGAGSEAVYDGTSFARDGVVCVTINYRLGPFGYLNLATHFPELADSANLGTLDQIAALKWVRENIDAFGGDPANVTIAGESAGAGAVAALLSTPIARPLFRRAILQSAMTYTVTPDTAAHIADYVLREIDVAPGDVDGLAQVPDDVFVQLADRMTRETLDPQYADVYRELAGSGAAFLPASGTELMPLSPAEALRSEDLDGIDTLIGCTANEVGIFCNGQDPEILPTGQALQAMLDVIGAPRGVTGEDVIALYRKSRPAAGPFQIDSAILTDMVFQVPSWRMADAISARTPNVWCYLFSWETPVLEGKRGAHHFLEIPFVFDGLAGEQARKFVGEEAPQSLADAMHQAWVAFVSTGSPWHGDLPGWPRWDANARTMMHFNTACEPVSGSRAEELSLWEGLL